MAGVLFGAFANPLRSAKSKNSIAARMDDVNMTPSNGSPALKIRKQKQKNLAWLEVEWVIRRLAKS